jgi:hypothetical protein
VITRAAARAVRTLSVGASLALLLGSLPACGWEDKSAGADMPWLGGGGRAHLYHQRSSCIGCPTGYKDETRWGRSAWSGADPYVTVGQAMNFLADNAGALRSAKSIGAGAIGGAGGKDGIIEPRALPYRMTVVMIEPTVVVMNFDLGAMIHEGEPQSGQIVGAAYIDGVVGYGTRVPATGSLLWFSPEAKAPPAPVANQSSGKGEIQVSGVTLSLERGADYWTVTRR